MLSAWHSSRLKNHLISLRLDDGNLVTDDDQIVVSLSSFWANVYGRSPPDGDTVGRERVSWSLFLSSLGRLR